MIIIGKFTLAVFERVEDRIEALKPIELLGNSALTECLREQSSHSQSKQ